MHQPNVIMVNKIFQSNNKQLCLPVCPSLAHQISIKVVEVYQKESNLVYLIWILPIFETQEPAVPGETMVTEEQIDE